MREGLKSIDPAILRHRIFRGCEDEVQAVTTDAISKKVLHAVLVPRGLPNNRFNR
jgi:hypothetical protein